MSAMIVWPAKSRLRQCGASSPARHAAIKERSHYYSRLPGKEDNPELSAGAKLQPPGVAAPLFGVVKMNAAFKSHTIRSVDNPYPQYGCLDRGQIESGG